MLKIQEKSRSRGLCCPVENSEPHVAPRAECTEWGQAISPDGACSISDQEQTPEGQLQSQPS